MEILIKYRKDKKKLEKSFQLFYQCANQFQDPEAFWRLSACYLKSIGTTEDKDKSFEYAIKAKECGSIEGTFWYAVNCLFNSHLEGEAFQCFHQISTTRSSSINF